MKTGVSYHGSSAVVVVCDMAGIGGGEVGIGGTDTVGMYSPGNAFVVYEMSRQVYGEAPSAASSSPSVELAEGGGEGAR